MTDDGDTGRYHHDGHDTEFASARRAKARDNRRRVLARFEQLAARDEGSTDYENGRALDMFRHAAGTRREELMAMGVPIVKTSERRRTDTGRTAIVWKLVRPALVAVEKNGQTSLFPSSGGDGKVAAVGLGTPSFDKIAPPQV